MNVSYTFQIFFLLYFSKNYEQLISIIAKGIYKWFNFSNSKQLDELVAWWTYLFLPPPPPSLYLASNLRTAATSFRHFSYQFCRIPSSFRIMHDYVIKLQCTDPLDPYGKRFWAINSASNQTQNAKWWKLNTANSCVVKRMNIDRICDQSTNSSNCSGSFFFFLLGGF